VILFLQLGFRSKEVVFTLMTMCGKRELCHPWRWTRRKLPTVLVGRDQVRSSEQSPSYHFADRAFASQLLVFEQTNQLSQRGRRPVIL
jgi:hypothetical protein